MITKLYFSEDKSAIDENQVRIGLEKKGLKWKMEANAANETSFQFQKENMDLNQKLYDIETQSNKTEESLNKRIKELEVKTNEEPLNKRIKELEEKVINIETQSNKTLENLRKRIWELEENDKSPQYQLF